MLANRHLWSVQISSRHRQHTRELPSFLGKDYYRGRPPQFKVRGRRPATGISPDESNERGYLFAASSTSHSVSEGYEAMDTIQEKIVYALRAAGRPMKALDIARAIGGGCEKRDVNRAIHKMREVEISNPGQNPPLWQLYTGTATPQLAQPHIVASSPSSSVRDTASAQSPGKQESVAKAGSDASLVSQLSKISIGDETSATWNSKMLTTVEPTSDGGLVIKPVSRHEVINQASSSSVNELQVGLRLNHPVQETVDCAESAVPEGQKLTSSSQTQRIDPINLTSGIELKKCLDKDVSESNPSSKQKEYASQVFDSTLQATGESRSIYTSPQQLVSSTPSKSKRKVVIAANFGGGDVPQDHLLKQKILDILSREAQPLDTFEVSKRLGHKDRVEALRALEALKREDKVCDVMEGGVSLWSIKVNK